MLFTVRDMFQGRCRASRYKLALIVHNTFVLPFSRSRSTFPIGGVNSPSLYDLVRLAHFAVGSKITFPHKPQISKMRRQIPCRRGCAVDQHRHRSANARNSQKRCYYAHCPLLLPNATSGQHPNIRGILRDKIKGRRTLDWMEYLP